MTDWLDLMARVQRILPVADYINHQYRDVCHGRSDCYEVQKYGTSEPFRLLFIPKMAGMHIANCAVFTQRARNRRKT